MNKSELLLKIVKIFNKIIPKKKNAIVLFSRPDYSDNCRIIYEKLTEYTGNKYIATWIVEDCESFKIKHSGIRYARHKSLKSLWCFCRAHYIIRTHSLWGGIYEPERQIMCYAFHGMGIKGFEYNIKDRYTHNSFEHFSVTSKLFADMFAEGLNADLNRFDITGLPRNDYLFVQPRELLEALDLSKYQKRIIWMPTFRENKLLGCQDGTSHDSGLPVISITGLDMLNKILSEHNYCLLIKLHQWAAESVKGAWSNIRVITDNDIPEPFTLYHFLGLMDVLLTDYSSVSTDYLLLNRPIGYVYDDLDEFRKTRYLPLDPIEQYMAGARINSEEQLFQFIHNIETDEYSADRERVAAVFLKDRDNLSTERYMKAIGLI